MDKAKSIFFLLCLSVSFSVINAQNTVLFKKKVYINQEGEVLLYRILEPLVKYEECSKHEKKYPLVLFLHGAGERGDDNEKQLIHGTGLFTKEYNRVNFPCFLIAPQCPEEKRWVEVSWKLAKHTMPKESSETMKLTTDLINQLIKKYPIDTSRIYITGLSMGGFGTWDLICRYPDKFAAAIPVCGGGDEQKAELIKSIPIWAFHGKKDKLVNVSRSRNMINTIKASGGNPKYTEYPTLGHLCWDSAYSEKELLKWMFSQSLKN